MKLGRWGWGLERLSLARFQRNNTMSFGESAKKWVAEALSFCHVNHAPLLPLSLDRFPQNFPRTRVQLVSRDKWFLIPERFPLRDRISRKTLFLGYPICDQPTGHGKRSATPTLFPSPSGHPTYVPFLGDFCWGMYRFPPIRLRKSPYQQWGYLDGNTVAPPGERRDTIQWGCIQRIWRNITRQEAPP